jgi:hypothetical protein
LDKNSHDISRYNIIIIFFAVFLNRYLFIPLFLSEHLTMFCGTLRACGTQFEKHWLRVYIAERRGEA